jgi:hypothetical protein
VSDLSVLWALIRATWGERLSRPLVGILALVFCASKVFAIGFTHELDDPSFYLTLLFTAGTVGRDVSSGVLPVLFTRPLARSTYVFAKWLAAGTAAGTIGALTIAIQALLLSHRGTGVAGSAIVASIFGGFTSAFGISSVLVFFSVLLSGIGDIALWGGLILVGKLSTRYVPQRVADEWGALLQPALDWAAASGSHPAAAFRVVSYLSTVTLCLCLAVMAANRKEISYAAG